MPLSDAALRKAKPTDKTHRLFDGGGLYLEITPAGGKLWRQKYRFGGKEKRLAHGTYPEVSLAEACEKREAARKLLAKDVDPGEHRKAEKAAGEERAANSFEVIAREWLTKRPWVQAYQVKVTAWMENDVFPWIGARPVADLTAPEFLKVARRVEARGAVESAHRIMQNCGQIMRYAIATGRADRNPVGDLKGALPPAPEKHHAAITDVAHVGGLLRAIDTYTGSMVTRSAMQLAPLVFVRPGELRQAEWAEIDFEKAEWNIPAEKMKMRQPHLVPLSKQAVAILTELQPVVTALTAATAATINQGVEIAKLAQIAGTGTEEFQRFAAGANTVGIGQEKLADIFKDVQDKVGDFMVNGAGPMADFFKNIAPLVGVTAKQFQNLSGPQALQLYVSTMEKAGLSHDKMVYGMEAIASDATVLLPLLENGAAGIKNWGDKAADAGAIMQDKTIAASVELKAKISELSLEMDGLRTKVAIPLIDSLIDISTAFGDLGGAARDAGGDFEWLGTTLKGIVTIADSGVTGIRMMGEGLAGTIGAAVYALKGDLATASELYKMAGQAQRDLASGLAARQDVMWNGSSKRVALPKPIDEEAAEKSYQDQKKREEELKKAADAAANASKAKSAAAKLAAEQARQLQESLNAQYERERDLRAEIAKEAQDTTDKQRAYLDLVKELNAEDRLGLDQAKERLKILNAGQAVGAASNDDDYLKAAHKAISGIGGIDRNSYSGPDALYGGASGEFSKIDKATESENEAYAAQLQALDEQRQARADLNAKWDAEEEALTAQHQKNMQALDDARWQVQKTAAQQAFDSIADVTRAGFGEQSGLYKAAFILQKTFALASAALNVQKAISDAASQPFPLNLVAMTTVAAETASILSNIKAIGMAHDGIDSVPQTGTWLLQKGERVTTAQTSAKLDATLDRVAATSTGGGGQEVHQHITVNGNPDDRTLQLIKQAAQDGAEQGHKRAASDVATGNGPISRAMATRTTVRRKVG